MDITLKLRKDTDRQEKCQMRLGESILCWELPLCGMQHSFQMCPDAYYVPPTRLHATQFLFPLMCPTGLQYHLIWGGGLSCHPNKMEVSLVKGNIQPVDLFQLDSWLK